MNLARLALKYNRTTIVVYLLVVFLGVSTYFTIGRLEYPEFTIRVAQIVTLYPGRTALQVEQEVTEPLEQAVRQMEEVKQVKSTSKNGMSILSVELEEHLFELDPIWQRLRNKVAATSLPDGAHPPSVNDEFGDVFPYIWALRGDGFSPRELLDYAEDIRDDLLELDGVAKVEFHGVQDERIYVEYSTSEVSARDLNPLALASLIQDHNAVASSGSLSLGEERIGVATLGEFESLEELRQYRLARPGSKSSVVLEDFARVYRGYEDPPRSFAHQNGERVICMAVSMVRGGIVTEVGERVQARLREIGQRLPIGIDIESVFFQPEYVSASIRDFVINLSQAFGFVALVMLLFAGWRIALIVAMLVPSAVLFSFAFMPVVGVQLEMMSIAALIIALGLLVDNAVVVSEQILVRINQGEARREACSQAVGSLAIPLLAASGTTIAAFSPIALAPGATSEFTYSLFAVVSLTLLSSWLLSMTVIPLFCYWVLRPLSRDTLVGRLLDRCLPPYESLLRAMLRHKALFLIAIVTAMGFAGWGFQFVPAIFFPPNERGQFVIDFELPLGRDLTVTEARVSELEKWLQSRYGEEIRSVSSWIGNGGPRWYLSLNPEPANPNYAFLTVLTETADPAVIRAMTEEIATHALDAFPDARVAAKALENGPPVGDPIQIRLYGRDMMKLYACRDLLTRELLEVEGVHTVRDNWGAWVKQLTVDPDPIRSARLGLSTAEVATNLSLQYRGLTVSNFREDDRAIPIVLRPESDYREFPERIQDIPILRADATAIPLSQVAEVSLTTEPGAILREDTLRVMTVKAKVRGRYSSAALADLRPRLETLMASDEWPAGYRIEYGGEQEESAEAQGGIAAVFPISLSILALILIAQFNSIRRFLIVLLTIPPMLCGVTPGLLLTGSTFGFMTLLGIIALLGIIVNNAILLIDEIDSQADSGLARGDAIIAAARSRLRPILMTTVTTIIGLLPLALGGGGMWSSMAWAMASGLAFSTVLTLVLCPVLYDLFFRSPKSVEH